MAVNIGILPRPWSGHYPKVDGYEPRITCKIEKISKSSKNSWRCQVLVDDAIMFTSHSNTKEAAESRAERMMSCYTEVHYRSRRA